MTRMRLLELPVELQVELIGKCSARALAQLAGTCHHLAGLVKTQSEVLLRTMCDLVQAANKESVIAAGATTIQILSWLATKERPSIPLLWFFALQEGISDYIVDYRLEWRALDRIFIVFGNAALRQGNIKRRHRPFAGSRASYKTLLQDFMYALCWYATYDRREVGRLLIRQRHVDRALARVFSPPSEHKWLEPMSELGSGSDNDDGDDDGDSVGDPDHYLCNFNFGVGQHAEEALVLLHEKEDEEFDDYESDCSDEEKDDRDRDEMDDVVSFGFAADDDLGIVLNLEDLLKGQVDAMRGTLGLERHGTMATLEEKEEEDEVIYVRLNLYSELKRVVAGAAAASAAALAAGAAGLEAMR
jgi:hypothetical protein